MRNIRSYIEELKGLDQNNIGSWPQWAYNMAVLAVAGLIFIIGTWYFILPHKERLAEAQAEEQELKQTYENKYIMVSNIDEYKKQIETMKNQFNELLQQLPSKSEVPNLLNDISQARVANGLKEELFKPMAEENRDFYVELPNALIVTGDYHELAHFVSDVAALSRIVTLQNVNIKPIDKKEGSTDNSGQLQMSVTATTYRYNESNQNDGIKSNSNAGGSE